jgi:RNA polymerase sigma-70 factor (ECF subfamily)
VLLASHWQTQTDFGPTDEDAGSTLGFHSPHDEFDILLLEVSLGRMPNEQANSPGTWSGGDARVFATTHWSVVLAAGANNSAGAAQALEQLCRAYWRPLYAYICRSSGHGPDDAQDLTQEFFACLLERNDLASVSPDKGRFRSFLLASLNHFLCNEWDRVRAIKRGARVAFISIDEESPEHRALIESIADLPAEKAFEKRWATALLDEAFGRLRQESAQAGRAELFDRLKPFLAGEPDPGEYGTVAAQLGWAQSSVAVAVHRLRQRYAELVREEIAHTVAEPGAVEAEMRDLFAALRGT